MLLEESMSLQLKHEYIDRFYIFYNFWGCHSCEQKYAWLMYRAEIGLDANS